MTEYWKSAMNKDLDFLFNSLLFSMGQEYDHYQELLVALEEEVHVLTKSTLEDILEFNKRKELLLLSLNMVSEMRGSAIKKIVSYLNLDEEPVSMTQLIAYAQNHTRQNLIDYQEKFADLISRIKQINEKNINLITILHSHVSNTLNYINSLTTSRPNYNQHGQIKAANLQGRLISQEG